MGHVMHKYQSIESLRAYMAWWVCLGHGLQLMGVWSAADAVRLSGIEGRLFEIIITTFLSGGSAVRVFIMVSGFVIAHLILEGREPYGKYITRRFFRLMPVMLVCVILALVTTPLYVAAYIDPSYMLDRQMRIDRLNEQSLNFWPHALAHATLFHGLIPVDLLPFAGTTFLAPAWSIGLEWQFYLIAPFLVIYLSRSINASLAVAVIFVGAKYLVAHQEVLHWQYDSFFFKVPDLFLIGIFTRIAIGRLRTGAGGAGLLGLAVLLLFLQDFRTAAVWFGFLIVLFYESGLFSLPVLRTPMQWLFLNDRVSTLGRWSYSTYLVHVPVFSVVVGVYVLNVGVENVDQYFVGLLLLGCAPIIAVLSGLMYRYIEAPPMRFIKRRLE